MTEEEGFPDALPVGYRLHWYALENVLGQGGFGITYLARDTNLDRRVAIKEYLPAEIARRRSDATAHPRTEALAGRYAWGLERFLLEARTLARFDHPNIVRVHSVFEANNTAYMVMRFEEGENLAALLDHEGTLPEGRLKDLLIRILDGLQLVHAAGFIHRDIKPENIYVRRDGSPVLLDFGSARQSFGNAKTMTILVAPGYAPLEQYYGDATTQGPWTDIYGLGATCYRAIAGRAPLDAIARAKGVLGSARELMPTAVEVGRGRYPEPFLRAIDHSLQLSEHDRPQTIDDWRRELTASSTASPPQGDGSRSAAPGPAAVSPANATADAVPAAPRNRPAPLLWAGVAAVALLAIAGGVFMLVTRPSSTIAAAPTPPAPASAPAEAQAAASEPVRVPEPPLQPAVQPAVADQAEVHKVVAITPRAAASPREGDRHLASRPAPSIEKATAATPAPKPAPAVASTPSTGPPAIEAPVPSVTAPVATTVAALSPPADKPASRSLRDAQLDSAEAALRRGDHAAAADAVAPWAAAGVARAQALLGRAQEGRRDRRQSDFEAYVWYELAARGGDAAAPTLRDKVAARLQPAEVRQAEQAVEHWRPRAESAPTAASR